MRVIDAQLQLVRMYVPSWSHVSKQLEKYNSPNNLQLSLQCLAAWPAQTLAQAIRQPAVLLSMHALQLCIVSLSLVFGGL